jgi:hypothetical protein
LHRLLHRYPAVEHNAICVVIGDDAGYAHTVSQLAKKTLKCQSIVIRTASTQPGQNGHFQDNFNAMGLEARCAQTKTLLTDIDLMASAQYFIGVPRSNLDNVVYALRQCKYKHAEDTTIDGSGRPKFGIWA